MPREKSTTADGAAVSGPEANAERTPPVSPKSRTVRVICDGVLGPLLLQKGEVTDDADYVALLLVEGQEKVEAVK